jgi:hypothetical protein
MVRFIPPHDGNIDPHCLIPNIQRRTLFKDSLFLVVGQDMELMKKQVVHPLIAFIETSYLGIFRSLFRGAVRWQSRICRIV